MNTTDLTVEQMAARHGVSQSTVRRRVASGEWPAGRNGRLIRFTPDHQQKIAELIANGYTADDDDLMERALRLLAA